MGVVEQAGSSESVVASRRSVVASRESVVASRESVVASRESGVASRGSVVGSCKAGVNDERGAGRLYTAFRGGSEGREWNWDRKRAVRPRESAGAPGYARPTASEAAPSSPRRFLSINARCPYPSCAPGQFESAAWAKQRDCSSLLPTHKIKCHGPLPRLSCF